MRKIVLYRVLVHDIAELRLVLHELRDVLYYDEGQILEIFDFIDLLNLKLKVPNEVLLLLLLVSRL
jgi:hypothetical protein